jgi:acetoin utilization deacetylase AcuC-like enzyme
MRCSPHVTPAAVRLGRGEGFCVFNDIAVSAGVAMAEYGIERVLVLDLDVHQGNGTAAIFENDPRVVTFDMHGGRPD